MATPSGGPAAVENDLLNDSSNQQQRKIQHSLRTTTTSNKETIATSSSSDDDETVATQTSSVMTLQTTTTTVDHHVHGDDDQQIRNGHEGHNLKNVRNRADDLTTVPIAFPTGNHDRHTHQQQHQKEPTTTRTPSTTTTTTTTPRTTKLVAPMKGGQAAHDSKKVPLRQQWETTTSDGTAENQATVAATAATTHPDHDDVAGTHGVVKATATSAAVNSPSSSTASSSWWNPVKLNPFTKQKQDNNKNNDVVVAASYQRHQEESVVIVDVESGDGGDVLEANKTPQPHSPSEQNNIKEQHLQQQPTSAPLSPAGRRPISTRYRADTPDSCYSDDSITGTKAASRYRTLGSYDDDEDDGGADVGSGGGGIRRSSFSIDQAAHHHAGGVDAAVGESDVAASNKKGISTSKSSGEEFLQRACTFFYGKGGGGITNGDDNVDDGSLRYVEEGAIDNDDHQDDFVCEDDDDYEGSDPQDRRRRRRRRRGRQHPSTVPAADSNRTRSRGGGSGRRNRMNRTRQPWRALVTPSSVSNGLSGLGGRSSLYDSVSTRMTPLASTNIPPRTTTISEQQLQLQNNHYQHIMMSPPVLANYRDKYRQLNQDFDTTEVLRHQQEQHHHQRKHRRHHRRHHQRGGGDHSSSSSRRGGGRAGTTFMGRIISGAGVRELVSSPSTPSQLDHHDLSLQDTSIPVPATAEPRQQDDEIAENGVAAAMSTEGVVQPTATTNTSALERPRHRRMESSGGASSSVEHSTLLYQLADGRLLMCLPRDHVKLIMDPDLDVGVLSVEQTRRPRRKPKHGSNSYNDYTSQDNDNDEIVDDENSISNDMQDTQQLPPLRYVLTVPDDLYRNIVSEMSISIKKPCSSSWCCCCFEIFDQIAYMWSILCKRCCWCCCDDSGSSNHHSHHHHHEQHDEHSAERLDIRVAIVILIIIMTILAVNALLWPS